MGDTGTAMPHAGVNFLANQQWSNRKRLARPAARATPAHACVLTRRPPLRADGGGGAAVASASAPTDVARVLTPPAPLVERRPARPARLAVAGAGDRGASLIAEAARSSSSVARPGAGVGGAQCRAGSLGSRRQAIAPGQKRSNPVRATGGPTPGAWRPMRFRHPATPTRSRDTRRWRGRLAGAPLRASARRRAQRLVLVVAAQRGGGRGSRRALRAAAARSRHEAARGGHGLGGSRSGLRCGLGSLGCVQVEVKHSPGLGRLKGARRGGRAAAM
jgi:hypothetical protein